VARIGLGIHLRERPVPVNAVDWKPIAGAETVARKEGKPVLYDFTAEWCPPCRKLSNEVFSVRKSADLINAGFYPVRVEDRTRESGSNPSDVAALQRRFKVNSFPTLVIVPPAKGAEPVVITGYPGKRLLVRQLEGAAGGRPVK
jgi:thiol:disulfide interchange protein